MRNLIAADCLHSNYQSGTLLEATLEICRLNMRSIAEQPDIKRRNVTEHGNTKPPDSSHTGQPKHSRKRNPERKRKSNNHRV